MSGAELVLEELVEERAQEEVQLAVRDPGRLRKMDGDRRPHVPQRVRGEECP
jgi:hypothetical protein